MYFRFQVSHLSDLLRLALLFKYGGIYSDSDILAFKSIDLQADSYVVRLRGGQIGKFAKQPRLFGVV